MRVLLFILTVYLSPGLVVEYWAKAYGVDPQAIAAIRRIESYGDHRAENPFTKAWGPMQVTPPTADYIEACTGIPAETILSDPNVNIQAGTWLFAQWYHRFNDLDMALASYYGGAAEVIECECVPDWAEHYIWKVREVLNWNWPERVCVDNSGRCLEEDE